MRQKQKLKQEDIFGIREIYCPPAPIEPEVDIVAVHGLNGSALGTWTTLDSGVCWLNDPRFLPQYVKNARILVWGYNASFSSLTGHVPSKDRIHHHAHTLVANLAADRRLSGTADKPIIFLCHSLGGIVVKRALTYAQTLTAPNLAHSRAIYTHTTSILFFGTPHHGTRKATWLHHLTRALAATPLHALASPRSDLVAALQLDSETLQNITDFFAPLAPGFRIFYFWELHPTNLLRDYVVPPASAVPAGQDDAERAGIAADHRGMVRFGDPAAPGFRVVADALVRYCAEAGEVVQQRRVEAGKALGMKRGREVAEALKSAGVVGAGGFGRPGGGMEPDLLLERADSRLEEWMGRTATFRSLAEPDEIKDEERVDL